MRRAVSSLLGRRQPAPAEPIPEPRKDPISAVIEAADYAQDEGADEVEAEFVRIRALLPEITEEVLSSRRSR